MNAVIYARKSDDDQVSVEEQIEISRRFCAEKGWPVVKEFFDNDITGTKGADKRPGFNAFLAACESKRPAFGPFGAVVVMSEHRLSRGRATESVGYQHRILDAGKQLWGYLDGQRIELDTPEKELVGNIKAYGNNAYTVNISKQTKSKLKLRHENGWATGNAPFGYRRVPQNPYLKDGKQCYTHVLLEPVEADAAIVRRIFDLAGEGLGNLRISKLLNRDNVATPRKLIWRKGPKAGQPKGLPGWDASAVGRVLTHKIYIGIIEYTGHDDTPAPHLAIITPEQWKAVKERKAILAATHDRKANGKLASKPETNFKHLLSGLLACPDCGLALGWQKGYYRCRANGKGKCGNNEGIPAAAVNRWVVRATVKLIAANRDAAVEIYTERQKRERAAVATHGDARAEALLEADRLEQEQAAALASIVSGKLRGDLLDAVQAAYDDRAAKIAALRATPATVTPFDRSQTINALGSVANKYLRLLQVDGNEEITRAALTRLGIGHRSLTARKRPDSTGWEITGNLDLTKALAAVEGEPEGEQDFTTAEEIEALGWLPDVELVSTPFGAEEERAG